MNKSVFKKVSILFAIGVVILLIGLIVNYIIDKRTHTVKGDIFVYEDARFYDGLITDEGLLLVGNVMMQLNGEGEVIWQKEPAGDLLGVIEVEPNQFLAFGYSSQYENYVVKFNDSGEITYEGSLYEHENHAVIADLVIEDNNDLILLDRDGFLLKKTDDGEITELTTGLNAVSNIFIDQDGNFLLYGEPNQFGGYRNLTKVNQDGTVIWTKRIEQVSDIEQDDNGNYITLTSYRECNYLCLFSSFDSSIQIINESGKIIDTYPIEGKTAKTTSIFVEDDVMYAFAHDDIYRLKDGEFEAFDIKTADLFTLEKVLKRNNQYILIGHNEDEGIIQFIDFW